MFRPVFMTVASLASACFALSSAPAHAASLPTYEAFGKSAECVALRKQYPTLVGQHLKVGLGGYTAGFEAPAKDDPSKIEGLDPDLIAYMGACLGYTHEFQNVAFNVLLTGITGKRFDMGPNLYVTEVRRKQVAFVSSFAVIDGSVIKKGNPKKLTSLDTLCGATVAAAAGTYEAVTLVPQATEKCKAANKPDVNLLLLQATDASVQAVVSGRADIYLTAHSDAKALAASVPGLESGFTVDLPILNGFPIAKENTTLRGAVLASMKVIQDKGIEKSLLDKWGQDAASQRTAADAE
ncbi:transporter substrate-binding domain-containing protein [Caballeronia sp. LZ034LL]|uniref:transporter substrate-binding domain-containing protein n=1 Tax=Caballeronia sp. LZ034LL TaxID=3038567 RepID=UPI00285991A8|nr:transporter substrate-binding domain-containing protein [Caballeronia sp. LZ034LL]MDR5836114.1 transporter substrate-binding domain-containing protein [Caballeronia sp. LZ034LL]